MEVDLDARGTHERSAAALGGAEAPLLDGFDGLLVQTEAGIFDDFGVVRTAIRTHLDHQHNDALEAGLARVFGELGIYAVDQLRGFERDAESSRPARF